jgi:predicted patatin/cPLA2 family phospholipase
MTEHDALVISGGGIYGILVLGALQQCIDINTLDLTKIDLLVGTSVGSIICYLLILGFYPTEIIHLIIRHRQQLDSLTSFNLVKLYNLEGGIQFTGIQQLLERITLDKTGTLFTLKSLYEKYDKTLVCSAYNYTLKKVEYISHQTYPDMPCILACTASSSIPIIFERCLYGDNCFIDGGIYDNLPIDYPILQCDKKYPLAFHIEYNYRPYEPCEKFHFYLYELYKIAINACANNKCEIFKDRANIIQIKPNLEHPIWWNMDNVIELLDMFSDGYNLCKDILKAKVIKI